MTSQEPPRAATNSPVLMAAVCIVLGLLVAGVALAFAGWKPESIGGLLTAIGTVATGLLVTLVRLTSVERKVEQVAHQTNGQLRAHITDTIRDTVRVEIREALALERSSKAADKTPTSTRRERR